MLPLSIATVSPRSTRKSGLSEATPFKVLVQLDAFPSWMLMWESVVMSKVKVLPAARWVQKECSSRVTQVAPPSLLYFIR